MSWSIAALKGIDFLIYPIRCGHIAYSLHMIIGLSITTESIKHFYRYVFDLYQDDPIFGNHSITLDNAVFSNEIENFGRLHPERRSITLTCAAWGNWSPPVLPICIRKKFDENSYTC